MSSGVGNRTILEKQCFFAAALYIGVTYCGMTHTCLLHGSTIGAFRKGKACNIT